MKPRSRVEIIQGVDGEKEVPKTVRKTIIEETGRKRALEGYPEGVTERQESIQECIVSRTPKGESLQKAGTINSVKCC